MHILTAVSQPFAGRPAGRVQHRWRILQSWLPLVALGAILLLGAYLRFYNLGSNGVGNPYYAATVQSMLTSWHNFFYAAYEPGGSVTVDKPPLGFWLQAIVALVLGVSGFSLALPQAIAGWLSLPLLYYLVRRQFGPAAGLLAALVLAITPVTVSTERNNTIDGTLVFVLLLAAWAFIKATENGRLRFLWLGALLVGIGFNIKMLQAFLPLPAFYALYLAGTPGRWWRKGFNLALATLLLLAVSLSWAIAVDLTPADERPYIGSSQNNTVMELIIGHNGLSRLLPGGTATVTRLLDGDEAAATMPGSPAGQPFIAPTSGNTPPDGPVAPGGPQRPGDGQPPNGGGTPFQTEIGQPGLLRLVSQPLVTEAGWLLPLALFGLIVAVGEEVIHRRGRGGRREEKEEMRENDFLASPDRPLGRRLALLLWGGWLLTEVAFFSVANLFHAYYLIMLGPPLAALVAAGIWATWQSLQRRAWWGWLLLFTGVAVTLALQIITLLPYPEQGWWLVPAALAVLVVGLLGLLLTFWWRLGSGDWRLGRFQSLIANLQRASIGVSLAAVLITPATWAGLTALNGQPNVALPRSGPASSNANLPGPPQQANSQFEVFIDYLEPRTADTTYLVATLSSMEASPFILATSRPVLTLGGFSGNDPVVDATTLAQMVTDDEIGYVLDNGSFQQRKPDVYNWLQANCAVVEELAGPVMMGGPGRPGPLRLFDCTVRP